MIGLCLTIEMKLRISLVCREGIKIIGFILKFSLVFIVMISFFGAANKLDIMVRSESTKKVISFLLLIFIFFLLTCGTYLYAWGEEIAIKPLEFIIVSVLAVCALIIFGGENKELVFGCIWRNLFNSVPCLHCQWNCDGGNGVVLIAIYTAREKEEGNRRRCLSGSSIQLSTKFLQILILGGTQ